MTVVLVNPFTVAPQNERAFLELWDATNAIFRQAPGYVDARLHAARADQPMGMRAPHTHVNVARWESAEAYEAALRDPRIKRLAGDYARVARLAPALYDVIRDI